MCCLNINKKTYYVLIGLLVLIPSAVFAADNYAQITMIPGQATNPIDIRASNGTSYFKVTPSGQVSIGTNHKICLDATCTTFFQSNGTSISGGSSSFTWAQISKVGSKLNDIGSPTSSYDMNSQPLNNVKFGNQVSLNGQTFNNNGHVSTFPSTTGTLVQQNGTFSGTLSSPTYSGNATFTKAGFPNTEIDPGSGTTGASYTIGIFGTTFYAKNGTTGKIDYSGTSATTVVSNAINNLPSTGGSIVFTKGTFPIHITVPKSNIRFLGQGWASTIFTRDGNNPFFNISSLTLSHEIQKIEIKDIKLNGFGYSAPSATDCIFTNATSYLLLERVYFTQCFGNGIYMEEAWDNKLYENFFNNGVGDESTGKASIYIYSGTRDNSNVDFIFQNHFERTGSTAIRSIGIAGGNHQNYMINIDGNKIEEHQQGGAVSPLHLINFTYTHYSSISNSYFTGSNSSSIYFDPNSFGNKLTANHFTGGAPLPTDCCKPLVDIDVRGINNIILSNSFELYNKSAINIGSSASQTFISGNYFNGEVGTTSLNGSNGYFLIDSTGLIHRVKNLSVGGTGTDAVNIVVGSGSNALTPNFNFDAFSVTPAILARQANGFAGGPQQTTTNLDIFDILAEGYTGSHYTGNIASIKIKPVQNFTNTAQGTNMLFSTTPLNSNVTKIGFSILNSGDIGINSTKKFYLDGILGTGDTYFTSLNPHQINGYTNNVLRYNITTTKFNINLPLNLTNNVLSNVQVLQIQNSLSTNNPTFSSADAGGRTMILNGNLKPNSNNTANYIGVVAGQRLILTSDTNTYLSSPTGKKQMNGIANTVMVFNGTQTGFYYRLFNATADPTSATLAKGFCTDWVITTNGTIKHGCNYDGTHIAILSHNP